MDTSKHHENITEAERRDLLGDSEATRSVACHGNLNRRSPLAAQEKARGCTSREVEMFLESGGKFFPKIIVGKSSEDPERAFAIKVVKQMRLKDFELLFNY
eukprot:jgi/Tetstr1/428260/TSEL_018299.t1